MIHQLKVHMKHPGSTRTVYLCRRLHLATCSHRPAIVRAWRANGTWVQITRQARIVYSVRIIKAMNMLDGIYPCHTVNSVTRARYRSKTTRHHRSRGALCSTVSRATRVTIGTPSFSLNSLSLNTPLGTPVDARVRGKKLMQQPYKVKDLVDRLDVSWSEFVTHNDSRPFFFYYSFPHVHGFPWTTDKAPPSKRGGVHRLVSNVCVQVRMVIKSTKWVGQ